MPIEKSDPQTPIFWRFDWGGWQQIVRLKKKSCSKKINKINWERTKGPTCINKGRDK